MWAVEKFRGLTGLFLAQPGDSSLTVLYEVEEVIYRTKSKYQLIEVVRLKMFGKALVLDGLIQSTETDEYIYHEALVHPAMVLHPNPQRVLILGGGEGATLREVLKHKTVKEAVMVDIDDVVVEVSKQYLPEWHQGAFEDKRAIIVIEDGFTFVKKALERGEKYDVIVMDLTDPYGSEIAYKLYSIEFFTDLSKILNSEGVIVTQAGNSFFFTKQYNTVVEAMRSVFKFVAEYNVWIPSFLYTNNFILASKKRIDGIREDTIDSILRTRGVRTRFYDGRRHVAMFYMPPFKRD